MDKPTIDATNAVFQAGSTIQTYFSQAVSMIDAKFGDSYAERHPELVAEFVRSQTMDFNSLALVAVLYEIRDALEARSDT